MHIVYSARFRCRVKGTEEEDHGGGGGRRICQFLRFSSARLQHCLCDDRLHLIRSSWRPLGVVENFWTFAKICLPGNVHVNAWCGRTGWRDTNR
ncbi:hypothetical protein T11_2276 [Trichinella zimbabwensis]|uniref:Uncharacterized protein n=1 Tax=Trichinella zimbabwensis TaxID=268475 RepID=A0A0V1I200_9BILA|nr:hypothetical protein T11_2276 [Trichinella zimbabwensis]